MATKISENFTLEELTYSDTAVKKKIKNVPDDVHLAHLKETVTKMAQPIRTMYNKGIKVTSGYRCKQLNAVIPGSSSTSMHTQGFALDIKPVEAGDMRNLMKTVLMWARQNNFDQIILEKCDKLGVPQWIHIGWKHTAKGQRRQILTATQRSDGKYNYNTYKG